MFHKRLRQVITAGMAALVLLSTLTAMATPVLMAAPVAQTLEAEAVAGVLTGGQFAKTWLKITPNGNGNVVVLTEWDRTFPENNGLGFYILDQDGLARVLSGSQTLAQANLSAGSRPSPSSPENQLGAVLQANGGEYTIVLYNDSPTDANFTLTATNASIADDSGQVRDLNATPTAADGNDEADAEDGDATPEPVATASETPAPAATTATTETVEATATPDATTAPAATTASTTATTSTTLPSNVKVTGNVVTSPEMKGELPTQNTQHYFDLTPNEINGDVTLTLAFDPQDSSELARRLNFWLLDQASFNAYADPTSDVVLSEIALAAGSTAPGLLPNQRQAKFTASGFGPYVLIVYNNSTVPGNYTITADGATLEDDSQQSLTAQQAISGGGSATTTGAATTTDAASPAAADGTTAPAAAPSAGSGIEGEPGGTYTVKAGDTLSLIAQAIYGELDYWNEICAFNNLANCNSIEVGQEIRLPTREELGAGIAPAATTAPVATATAAPAGAAAAAAAAATATTTSTATATPVASETMTDTDTVTETTTTTDTGSTTGSTSTGSSVNLVETLEAQGGFATFLEMLEAANLTTALEQAGPFTIFAPTDAALEQYVTGGQIDQLMGNPTGQLTQIILFHVLPGSVAVDDITNGMQATTQQGKPVGFEVDGTSGGIKINGSNVTVPDIEASNGVIYAIDNMIIPPPD